MKKLSVLPALLTLLFGAPAFADVYPGFVACSSGDNAIALKEGEPLAEQGDAAAQSILGVMYDSGQGVT